MRKFIALLASVIAAFFLAEVFFQQLVSDAHSANSASKAPIDLTGSWHEALTDTIATNMTADVSDGHIQIMMYSDVVNGLYWDGSFKAKQTTSTFDVVSVADSDALSQDPTKTFTYKNGILSYDFTMLGQSHTIHLSRGE